MQAFKCCQDDTSVTRDTYPHLHVVFTDFRGTQTARLEVSGYSVKCNESVGTCFKLFQAINKYFCVWSAFFTQCSASLLPSQGLTTLCFCTTLSHILFKSSKCHFTVTQMTTCVQPDWKEIVKMTFYTVININKQKEKTGLY